MPLCRYLESSHLPGAIRGASLDVESDHTGIRFDAPGGRAAWVPLFTCASRRTHCITPPDLQQRAECKILWGACYGGARLRAYCVYCALNTGYSSTLEGSHWNCFHDEPGGSFPTKPHHTFRNLGCALDPTGFLLFILPKAERLPARSLRNNPSSCLPRARPATAT